MSSYPENRKRLTSWLRSQLIGPASIHETLHKTSPLERYPTGVLFPVVRGEEGLDPALITPDSDLEDEDTALSDENSENKKAKGIKPVTAQPPRYIPPSSLGFSFFVKGQQIQFQVISSAVRYQSGGEKDELGRFRSREYRRIPLGGDREAVTCRVDTSERKRFRERKEVFQEITGEKAEGNTTARAGIDLLWRPFADGWIVTVSLFNKQELDTQSDPKTYLRDRNQHSLFEVKLSCVLEAGEVGAYPRVDHALLNEEELELELQYRDRHIYAVGHGAAVNWSVHQGKVRTIESEFLPEVEVPQVTADVGNATDILSFSRLAAGVDLKIEQSSILDELEQFTADYDHWITGQEKQAQSYSANEQKTAARITRRMNTACKRMRQGVTLLRTDSIATRAFSFANQAMLDQMMQADLVNKGSARPATAYKWRPFQLAFLLMALHSSVHGKDEFRDIVDLIWFPTGGGKTEAYLGLIAFIIAWRRMKFAASGGGTTVLMRYTLRLLTVQQYQRATRMICALELIRWKNPELGREPITVGLWVGRSTSPNTFHIALNEVRKAVEHGTATQKLVLDSCPWCGTAFHPVKSFQAGSDSFHFLCNNENFPESFSVSCPFARQQLPCNIVDEALYTNPPTLLLATIDKFARLAWDDRADSFFGNLSGNTSQTPLSRPPELVIQDELHLIAGALGSIAGLYEAALDTVLIQRGVYPKYIASTATICMASQQVKQLYGRKLAIFPPPGLSCDDSWFAKTVPLTEKPGRLYVGYLAPMLNRQRCLAPLAAALHVAPEAVFQEGEQEREDLLEAWWTMVVYHGSLKGVTNSHNSIVTSVRELVERLKEEILQESGHTGKQRGKQLIKRAAPHPVQLTSIASAEENALTFSQLENPRTSQDCLDAVLATNMISVGLDVDRLALMIINGQPLTTAEYIQASSRVGRSRVPGLVVANYYRDQSRSLSHYENFRPYHESFYRFVEPTSVTPFTHQARSRALHAALVIAIRHSCTHLLKNHQAGDFVQDDTSVRKVVATLKQRCKKAIMAANPAKGSLEDESKQWQETARDIDRLVVQWHIKAEECRNNKRMLCYQVADKDKAKDRLLYNHDDRISGLWQTLQSMRTVENTALVKTL